MSDMIRMLLESRMPSDAIQGDFLNGSSMADVANRQSGEMELSPELLLKLQQLAAGMRPDPLVNALQLDR
jgi:hypothetical protein